MKKVILFLLIIAVALGGIGFAHAVVSESQDDLLVYPTLEVGDPSVLEGLTASMTFACGNRLLWHTDYPFGGEAVTEFTYSREAIELPSNYSRNQLKIWLAGGVGAGISGGGITPKNSGYGLLLKAVADVTANGESKTMTLTMSDYVDYYMPDYELSYEDDSRFSSEYAGLDSLATNLRDENHGCYIPLMQHFRFPVRQGDIMNVTVTKDDAGHIVGIDFFPESSPTIDFISDLTSEGIWFVPVFRDENGAPLPYESPAGHGIYFIPWRNSEYTTRLDGKDLQGVTPDVRKAQLRVSLEESLQIEHMVIDAEAGTARMLTLENGTYVLSTCDLQDGTIRTRLELLPHDPDNTFDTAYFVEAEDYLLVLTQNRLTLTDAAGEILYLSAEDSWDQSFGAIAFDPDSGDLRYDGETLILTDTVWYRAGTFWAAAWRQGERLFYGEYDCSLMRGNDDWYYSYINVDDYPLVLK